MTNKKCIECENDTLLKYSDLSIEYDKIERWNKILQECLDVKEELCDFYREENDTLKQKVRLYKDKLGEGS